MSEAFFESDGFIFVELVGVDVFDDGKVFGSGTEVLAEGEDGDVVVEEVVHGGEDFVASFAEAEHDAGFGGDVAVDHLFGFFKDDE